ncbi:Rho GTPase activating protein 39 [Tritrichomonas musculus]|uniref:Rho GTPase activating protein 39 n=1 Tax=Tritrichomonas musculus TaxID=1915356 RepID=A0ABR2IN97_9EUKA
MLGLGPVHLYYAYYDDDNQLYYYYDTDTEKTTWTYPKDGLVKDPETFKTFANPDILFPSIRSSISSKVLKPDDDGNQEIHLVVDLDEKLIKFMDQSPVQSLDSFQYQNKSNSNQQNKSIGQDQTEKVAHVGEVSQNREKYVDEEELQYEEDKESQENNQNDEISQSQEQLPNKETKSSEQMQSEDNNLSLDEFQSEETSQSHGKNQRSEQFLIEETNQSSEQLQTEETNQSSEQLQTEETNQNSEQLQTEETNQNKYDQSDEKYAQNQNKSAQSAEKADDNDNNNSAEIKHKFYVPPNENEPHFLPRTVSDEIHNYHAASFAKRHFQKNVNGRICRRTSITMEDLVLFSKTPLSSPLLANLSDNTRKNALKCFKFILQATGVSSSSKSSSQISTLQTINDSSIPNPGNTDYFSSPQAVDIIISMLYDEEALIDEVFFQLMKQTNQCPRFDWLIQTWNLFLVIASIFPSTKDSELWIKSFLMKNIADKNKEIGTLVQFILIRFNIRCSIGCPIDKTDLLIDKTKTQPNEKARKIKKKAPYVNIFNFVSLFNCTSTFGVSLYEIMWSQRLTYPNCPIPTFLCNVCKAIIEKNAFNTEGVFRLPGSMKEVERLSKIENLTEDDLKNARLHDLASLLKKWIRDLSEPIIPYQYSGQELYNAFVQGRIIEYVSSFPRLHALTLAYLIGFLQEMALHEDKTKMGPGNLAIVFAPNIIRQPEKKDDGKQNGMSFELISMLSAQKDNFNTSHEIIERLIVEWDVSNVYPLADDVLLPA